MEIPERYRVYEATHWLINHRMDSALPGYLMLGAKRAAHDLCGLCEDALLSLGPLLAKAQNTLQTVLKPKRVYIGRYGHTPGLPNHFHLIPVYDWVERLFWKDVRYRRLHKFAQPYDEKATDGAELTFYVWREFCERSGPPPVEGPPVAQAIALLQEAMRDSRTSVGYRVPSGKVP